MVIELENEIELDHGIIGLSMDSLRHMGFNVILGPGFPQANSSLTSGFSTSKLVGGLEPWNFMTFHSVGNVILSQLTLTP